MNTLNHGVVRTIVFKEEDTWYGVGLEFGVVVESETAESAQFELNEAIRGYVESLKKIHGMRIETVHGTLNQQSDPEYEEMWQSLSANKPIPSPVEVSYYGFARV